MCTYTTVAVEIEGSAKGPNGSWSQVAEATVYFDHPVHAMAEHTLNIDIATPTEGAAARIALELSATSARRLVAAINEALASAPPELTG
jgi:hypothetical protein